MSEAPSQVGLPETMPRSHTDAGSPAGLRLTQIRTGFAELGDRLTGLSRRLERPIMQVAAFLAGMQDLEAARPSTAGGGRLVIALQSCDMFQQEIHWAGHFVDVLTLEMEDQQSAAMPGDHTMLVNAESIGVHLDSARTIIENAAGEIPHALAEVLQGAGASPGKFQQWGIHRSLAEIGALTSQLARASGEVEQLRRRLAVELGEDPNLRQSPALPAGDYGDGSVMLF